MKTLTIKDLNNAPFCTAKTKKNISGYLKTAKITDYDSPTLIKEVVELNNVFNYYGKLKVEGKTLEETLNAVTLRFKEVSQFIDDLKNHKEKYVGTDAYNAILHAFIIPPKGTPNTLIVSYITDNEDMYEDTNREYRGISTFNDDVEESTLTEDPKEYPPFAYGCDWIVRTEARGEKVYEERAFSVHRVYQEEKPTLMIVVPNDDISIRIVDRVIEDNQEQNLFWNSDKYVEAWRK